MSQDNEKDTLVAHKDALSVYFDALLRDEELAPEAPAAPVVTEIKSEPQVLTPTPAPEPVAAAKAKVESVVPQWGEGPFQALLFKVAGLTLAVPLVELSGVQEWDSEALTSLPGHQPWYLGLCEYRERSVPVVDTALLVLPEDRLQRLTQKPEERLNRVVYIDDGRWGLACDEVAEVVSLTPDKVRWRTSRTKRQWLAGTVIDHMCAIIDPPSFATMLATGIEDADGAEDDPSADIDSLS